MLRALLATLDDIGSRSALAGVPLALGWATVELDRAADELGSELGVAAARFLDAPVASALGARCRVADGVLPGGLALALLEPSTEGRLAASLARFGEGPAVVWLAVPDLTAAAANLRARGLGPSAARSGPFGTERLMLDRPVHGPHQLLVERAGTIRS